MSDPSCPFCRYDSSAWLIAGQLGFVVADAYPVSRGHSLIVPRRHISSVFEVGEEEAQELWRLLQEQRDNIMQAYRPEGFNVGINDGLAAGQTIQHAHIHLIPRYAGDADDPRGGIRRLFAKQAAYWNTNT